MTQNITSKPFSITLLFLLLGLLNFQSLKAQDELLCPHKDTSKAVALYEKGKAFFPANIDSAVYYTNKSKELFKSIECWEQVARMSYNVAIMYAAAKDMKSQAEELTFAQLVCQLHLPDTSKWKAKVFLLVGQDYMQRVKLDSALAIMKEAQKILKKTASWKEYVNACRSLARVALYQQDYVAMEAYIDDAFDVTKNKLENDQNQVRNILQLYGVLYYRTGDFESALERTQEGLEIVLKDMKTKNDTALVASYYNNIGLFYIEVGDIAKAEDYCNNALNMSVRLGDNYKAATIYLNLAEFFQEKKQFQKASFYSQKGFEVLKKVSMIDISQSDIDRTYIQLNLGFARSAQEMGNSEPALEALKRNLDIHKRESYKLELTLLNIGIIHRQNGKMKEATSFLNKALEKALKVHPSEKHPDLAEVYFELSKLALLENNDKLALIYLQKGEESLVMKFNAKMPENMQSDAPVVSDKDILVQILEERARILFKSGAMPESYGVILQAVKTIDDMRNSFKTEGSKLFLVQKVIPIYELAIQIAVDRYQNEKNSIYLEKAFELVEKSKSILLLDALRTEEARAFGNLPDELLREERRLTRELAKKQKQLFEVDESQNNVVEQLQLEILELKRKVVKLQDTLEANYSKYYDLKYNEKLATLQQVKEYLDTKTVLIEYFIGNDNIYVFTIYKDSAKIYFVPKENSFELQIKSLRLALTSNTWLKDVQKTEDAFDMLSDNAYALYTKYVEPSLKAGIDRIVVIPDGLLNYIPFDVLLTKKADKSNKQDFKNLAYLIKDYTIHYHYSASLMLFDRKKSKSNGRILGFAPTFVFDDQELLKEDERQHRIRSNVDELPGAKQEIMELSKVFKGTYLYDGNANERKFKSITEKETYGVIHLAMHGWVDEERPQLSSLVFSHVRDSVEDNLLHAYELNLLQLQADLVVLSACETGFGKYERGEGVVSIGRGFMYAGIPSLVMTLWPINDRATAILMTTFYNHLSKGLSKDAAMRAAKLDYINSAEGISAHPFFWASFVTLGDPEPIHLRKKTSIWAWAGLGLGIILMFGGAYYYMKSKKKQEFN